jgi:isopentenyl-diphosphate delta-isomerase
MTDLPSLAMTIDLVDPADRVVGEGSRNNVFRQKDAFRVVHILVFDRKGRLLLQQLSASRERNPLHWGSSVAAYLFSGESYEEAAHRRLEQELGVLNASITPVGITTMLDAGVVKFISLFKTALSDTAVTPDPAHIATTRWFSLEEIDRAIRQRSLNFTPTFLEVYSYFRVSDAVAPRRRGRRARKMGR